MDFANALAYDGGSSEVGVGADYQLIRAIEIDNFRCFKEVRLPDLRRFTVVTGDNGSGKTALLESVFVASGGSPEVYIRVDSWRGPGDIQLPRNRDGVIPVFEDLFYQFNVETGLRISFRDSQSNNREVRIYPESQELLNIPIESSPQSEMIEAVPTDLVFYWKTPSLERTAKIQFTKEGTVEMPAHRDLFPVALITSRTTTARDNAARYSALAKKNKEREILSAVQQLFPHVLNLSIQMKGGQPDLFAEVSGVDRKMYIGLLSSGINRFISILLAISYREQGAVLIDEIETGFHYKHLPEMWRLIMDQCRKNHSQLIVTTHSKEFLDCIAPLVKGSEDEFSLLRTERQNGEAKVLSFSGREFSAAISSGFEIR